MIQHLHDAAEVGLNFVSLYLEIFKLILFTDASFANVRGLKIQLGILLLIVDEGLSAKHRTIRVKPIPPTDQICVCKRNILSPPRVLHRVRGPTYAGKDY